MFPAPKPVNVGFHGKKGFVDVILIRISRQGDSSGLSESAWSDHRGPNPTRQKVSVLVHSGCYNKTQHGLGGLLTTDIYFSRF